MDGGATFTCTAAETYSFSAGGNFDIFGAIDYGVFIRTNSSGNVIDIYGVQGGATNVNSDITLANDIDASVTSNWTDAGGEVRRQ